MNVQLKRIEIHNFKGIDSREVDFGQMTEISGPNASGKTTIYDAFTWALFGKDSTGAKDFSIKSLLPSGEQRTKEDISVSATLEVNGSEAKYTRVQREKWVRKRGSEVEEYTGNETVLSIDDVPLTATQYNGKVGELVREDLFKLLTDVKAFNSLHWTERRKILLEITGGVSEADILAEEPRCSEVLAEAQGKLEDYRKKLMAKRKSVNDEVTQIPARIDEVKRSKPEYDEAEHEELKRKVAEQSTGVDHLRKIQSAKLEVDRMEAEGHSQLRKLREQEESAMREHTVAMNLYNSQRESVTREISSLEMHIESHQIYLQALRGDYLKVKDQTPTGACPSCGGPVNAEDFNLRKAKRLEELTSKGNQMKTEVTEWTRTVAQLKDKLIDLQEPAKPTISKVSEEVFWSAYRAMPEYRKLRSDIADLEREAPVFDSTLEARLAELNAVPGRIAQIQARVEELTNTLREGHQELARIDKHLMLIERYWKILVTKTNEKLETVFPNLRFKMFNQLLNGGEEPTCETLINGVPYVDANHAAQINSGLEIIEAIANHYGVKVPVFVDNAEAVTDLVPVNLQVVKLTVKKSKKLEVTY